MPLLVSLVTGCGGGTGPSPFPAPSQAVVSGTAPFSHKALPKPLRALAAQELPTPTQLMDWAERAYAPLFPTHEPDRSSPPYTYRYYPGTETYLGVANGEVYLMRAANNFQLQHVGSLAQFACGVNPEACGLRISPDYFPADHGNWWGYDVGGIDTGVAGYDSQVRTMSTQLPSGPAWMFQQSNALTTGDALTSWYSKDARALQFLGDTTPSFLVPITGPYDAARFDGTFMAAPLAVRTNVDTGFDANGDGINERDDLRLTGTIEGYEAVTTPAGSFSAALKLRYDLTRIRRYSSGQTYTITTSTREWRSSAVGLVRKDVLLGYATRTDSLRGYIVAGHAAGTIGPATVLEGVGPAHSLAERPGSPAIAADGQRYLLVSGSEVASGVRTVARFVEASGQLHETIVVDPNASGTGDAHAVAWNGTDFLVVASKGELGVRGQRISATGTVLDASPGIALGGSYGRPAVAAGSGKWLAVYRKGSALYGRLVSGAGVPGAEFEIATGVTNDATPAVAFDGTNFLVAWESGVGSGDPGATDLYLRLVTTAGAMVGDALVISNAPEEQRGPRIACDPQNCLVTWRDRRANAGAPYNFLPGPGTLYGAFVARNGTVGNAFPVSPALDSMAADHALAFTGSDYVAAWTGGTFAFAGNASTAGVSGTRISTEGAVSPVPMSISGRPSYAARYFYPVLASIPGRPGAIVVWLNNTEMSGTTKRLDGALVFPQAAH